MKVMLFPPENRVIYENVKKYDKNGQVTDDDIRRRMRFASGITKTTHIHSESVILIDFPGQ